MGIGKIKLRPSVRLYTKKTRIRFDYTCQKCLRKYDRDDTRKLANLGVSHYWGRSKENTRFDDDNTTLLCNMPCHTAWEAEKKTGEKSGEYTEYMIERLGQKGFEALELKSNTYKKRDDKTTIEELKKALAKEYREGIKVLEELQ